jgi:hypothetical protein
MLMISSRLAGVGFLLRVCQSRLLDAKDEAEHKLLPQNNAQGRKSSHTPVSRISPLCLG